MDKLEDVYRQLQDNRTEHTKLMEKIDKLTEKLEEVSIAIATLPADILKQADERYAGKPAERIVYGMVGVVLTVVLMALLYLIIKGQLPM